MWSDDAPTRLVQLAFNSLRIGIPPWMPPPGTRDTTTPPTYHIWSLLFEMWSRDRLRFIPLTPPCLSPPSPIHRGLRFVYMVSPLTAYFLYSTTQMIDLLKHQSFEQPLILHWNTKAHCISLWLCHRQDHFALILFRAIVIWSGTGDTNCKLPSCSTFSSNSLYHENAQSASLPSHQVKFQLVVKGLFGPTVHGEAQIRIEELLDHCQSSRGEFKHIICEHSIYSIWWN